MKPAERGFPCVERGDWCRLPGGKEHIGVECEREQRMFGDFDHCVAREAFRGSVEQRTKCPRRSGVRKRRAASGGDRHAECFERGRDAINSRACLTHCDRDTMWWRARIDERPHPQCDMFDFARGVRCFEQPQRVTHVALEYWRRCRVREERTRDRDGHVVVARVVVDAFVRERCRQLDAV